MGGSKKRLDQKVIERARPVARSRTLFAAATSRGLLLRAFGDGVRGEFAGLALGRVFSPRTGRTLWALLVEQLAWQDFPLYRGDQAEGFEEQ
jgi:hypothetical protein